MTQRGWTYDEIGRLTLGQLRNEQLRGKSPRAEDDARRAARRTLERFKAGEFGRE